LAIDVPHYDPWQRHGRRCWNRSVIKSLLKLKKKGSEKVQPTVQHLFLACSRAWPHMSVVILWSKRPCQKQQVISDHSSHAYHIGMNRTKLLVKH
jgi:hypothetical protein